MNPTRIAVVTSHPIQYATPLYAYLNRSPELEITALFCSDFSLRGEKDPGFGHSVKWDVPLLDGYHSVFLGKRAHTRSVIGFWSLVCPELIAELRSARFDAVLIHGHAYAAYVLAYGIARARRIPVFMRGETHLRLSLPSARRTARDRVLAHQYRHIARFLAIGSANREYYLSLGVPDDRIFLVPYAVDNERFMRAATLSAEERRSIRQRFGVSDDRPVVLYASKFMPRKHPDDLLRAAAELRSRGRELHVVMAGAGEMKGELEALASRLELGSRAAFPGFVNQTELPKLYAAADIFVLPSENEPWGLVVNEVMCAGVPVVVGEDVGCVPDLVKKGVNGATCRPGDAQSLANALEPLVRDASLRARMGREGKELISRWGFEQCRTGVLSAVRNLRPAPAD